MFRELVWKIERAFYIGKCERARERAILKNRDEVMFRDSLTLEWVAVPKKTYYSAMSKLDYMSINEFRRVYPEMAHLEELVRHYLDTMAF